MPEQTAVAAQSAVARRFYSIREAARVLNVSTGTIYNRLGDRSLTAKKIGHRILIEVAELDRFITAAPDAVIAQAVA